MRAHGGAMCIAVPALAALFSSLLTLAGAASFQSDTLGNDVQMKRIGHCESGVVNATSMEILDFDPNTYTVAVVDASDPEPGITVLNLTNPSYPNEVHRINYTTPAAGQDVGTPTNVAFYSSIAVVAAQNTDVTADGFVTFWNVNDGMKLAEVNVTDCPLPDHVAISDDGMKVYIACEGEPSTETESPLDPSVTNPPGAIGVVDVAYTPDGMLMSATFNKSISLQAYIDSLSDDEYMDLMNNGLVIDGRVPKSQAAVVMEPEYIALGGGMAYVTLQENNAIAVIDLMSEMITDIWPLGFKDWSGELFDLSDKDGGINRKRWSNVWGIFQPDTIVYHEIGGKGYLFTANEGAVKENYRLRAGSLSMEQVDSNAFPNWGELSSDDKLGRLEMNPFCGLRDGYNTSKGLREQGPYHKICAYGGRSFSILDAMNGDMIYDSGDDLEDQIEKEAKMLMDMQEPSCFNCDNDRNEADERSDQRGGEPEAIEVMTYDNRTFAFVGLERQSSILVYEVTDPTAPVFVHYYNDRNYSSSLTLTPKTAPEMGLLGPEMVKFIPASMSPNGKPLLLSSGEVSGTLAVFQLDLSHESFLVGSNKTINIDAMVEGIDIDQVDNETFAEDIRSAFEDNLIRLFPNAMETARVEAGSPSVKDGYVYLPLTVTLDSRSPDEELSDLRNDIAAHDTSVLFQGSTYSSQILLEVQDAEDPEGEGASITTFSLIAALTALIGALAQLVTA